jgi:regulator of sigma E protease
MNLLIAFVILFALAFQTEEISGPGLEIEALTTESPAEGRLMEGDRVVSIDGLKLNALDGDERADRFREQIGTHTCAGGETTEGCEASTPVRVVVERDGAQVPVAVSPRYDPEQDQVLMGVAFDPTDITPVDRSVGGAAVWSVDRMWFVTRETVLTLVQLFDPEKREEVSGIVGGYETTRQAIDFDAVTAFTVIALISLSLAIINLFPFLPLDGGHIFWSVVEKVRGRRVSFETMERSGAIGFVLILFLFFIGLSNDIDRLTGDGFDLGER